MDSDGGRKGVRDSGKRAEWESAGQRAQPTRDLCAARMGPATRARPESTPTRLAMGHAPPASPCPLLRERLRLICKCLIDVPVSQSNDAIHFWNA